MAIITRQWVCDYVGSRSRDQVEYMVGRACLVLAQNQTLAERMAGRTMEQNGRGFSKFDSKLGTKTAEMFAKFGAVTDEQFRKWTQPNDRGVPRIAKYWKQLNQAAEQNKFD